MITRQGPGISAVLTTGGEPATLRRETAPVACFPHATESAARREAGPLRAVARGKDGFYRALPVRKAEWLEMSAPDRAAWCAASDIPTWEDLERLASSDATVAAVRAYVSAGIATKEEALIAGLIASRHEAGELRSRLSYFLERELDEDAQLGPVRRR